MGRATFGDPSVWSRLKGEEHSERSQSLTQVRGFPNSHPHESILKASPPQTPSDTTCCRELTKGGADRSPQLFCGSCDFHVLSSSQGIFSSSSFPLARSKNFLTTIQAFPKGRGEKKNHTSLLNSSFPGREVLGWVAKLELAHSPADKQLLLVPGSGFG